MAKKGRGLLTRLLDKTNVGTTDECWEWQGATNNIGYGLMRDHEKMRTTHRISYEEHNNTKIPKGLCVCHTCDNPLCVNPKHLWLGTMKQNVRDMISKGRQSFFNLYKVGHGPMLGRRQPTSICPHCARIVGNNVFDRYHNENCKHKPQD